MAEHAAEIESLETWAKNAFRCLWCLARESGGTVTVSVNTLHEMTEKSRIETVPSADGMTVHIKATA